MLPSPPRMIRIAISFSQCCERTILLDLRGLQIEYFPEKKKNPLMKSARAAALIKE